MGKKIFILGAGCSVKYGYPLAKDFANELEAYGGTLALDSPDKKRIEATLDQMRNAYGAVETVDELVARAEYSLVKFGNETPDYTSNAILKEKSKKFIPQEQEVDREIIRNAKLVTGKLFLQKEVAARKTGLRGYHDLLNEIIPRSQHWLEAFDPSNCHVFTFNYDRLFEIAFRDHFGSREQECDLYGVEFLNSGLADDEIKFHRDENHFSFLKLHGSVGVWVRRNPASEKPGFDEKQTQQKWNYQYRWNNSSFCSECICNSMISGDASADVGSNLESNFQPLLAFPHEKHHNNEYDLDVKPYIDAVWKRAQTLIKDASEIWIIGYSFSAVDRNYVFDELLFQAKSCRRFVVQNPDAERLCTMLRLKYPKIESRLMPFTSDF